MIDWNPSHKATLPKELQQANKIHNAIAQEGGESLFVGGAVRDWLYNSKITDIDIATTLLPNQVLRCLRNHNMKSAGLAGIAYGTVAMQLGDGKVEITTLRKDTETYGRAAKVEFGTNWQTDAQRRDFTINAIYASGNGEVYDPVGGVDDLKNGRVVFIGDATKRILEDNLRILRFFRFYARFSKGNEPEAATLAQCLKHSELIAHLSAERVRDELLKLLALKQPTKTLAIMEKANIASIIHPSLANYKRLYAHIKAGFAPCALTRLAAWIKGKPNSVATRLKLSKKQTTFLEFIHQTNFTKKEWRVRILKAPSREAVLKWIEMLRLENAITPSETKQMAVKPPPVPIRGKDLVKMGLEPSLQVGQLLAKTIRWWAHNNYKPTKKECLEYAKDVIGFSKDSTKT